VTSAAGVRDGAHANLPTCSLKLPTRVAPLRWAGLLRCRRPLTAHQLEGALAAHDHTGRRHRRARVAPQVQFQVTNARGSSATGKILPPLESSLPPDCQCEVAPAPTEFDYIPTPAITSVSTSATDPGSLASEKGGTVITATGKGFDGLTLLWADFGNPGPASSMSYAITYLTGTEMQILAAGLRVDLPGERHRPARAGTTVKVTVTTVESDFTGSGPSRSTATFSYTP
jgi:hypothetical protein